MLHYTRLKRLARDKHSSLLGPFITYEENKVLQIRTQGPYSQHVIFSASNKWAQLAIVLHYTWLKRLARDKHSSLLGPFVIYKENKVLRIRPQGPYSQHVSFSASYKWAELSIVLHYTRLKRLSSDKHLLGPFVTYEENKVLRIQTQVPVS
jgi:hypothetical protein